jgi:hypothetical protein
VASCRCASWHHTGQPPTVKTRADSHDPSCPPDPRFEQSPRIPDKNILRLTHAVPMLAFMRGRHPRPWKR